jgi:hypothetical protein
MLYFMMNEMSLLDKPIHYSSKLVKLHSIAKFVKMLKPNNLHELP